MNAETIIARLTAEEAALPDPGDLPTPNGRRRVEERASILGRTVQQLRSKGTRLVHLQAKLADVDGQLAAWAEVRARLETELEAVRAEPVKDPGSWNERSARAVAEQGLEAALKAVEFGHGREAPNVLTATVDSVFGDGLKLSERKPQWWLAANRNKLVRDVADAEALLQAQVRAAQALVSAGAPVPMHLAAADAVQLPF